MKRKKIIGRTIVGWTVVLADSPAFGRLYLDSGSSPCGTYDRAERAVYDNHEQARLIVAMLRSLGVRGARVVRLVRRPT